MKVIGITGYKKSGKTTLTLKLSDELIKRGYKVAVIKHINENIDQVNTDTSKYKEVLTQVAAITPEESVIFLKNKKNLEEIIKHFEVDIILIEGFKNEKTFPKIICLREESEKAELFDGLQLCTAGFVSKELNPKFHDYNILKDEVQIKVDPEDEKSYRLPRWGELEYITSKYSYFLSHKVTEDSTSVYGYFIKYFGSEKVQFYGKPVAKVLPAQSPETSYDRGRPATIQVISRFYIQIDHEPLKEVKIRERDFRKLFGNSKVMRMYFKEHKVNKIEDIVEMLRFYEESV